VPNGLLDQLIEESNLHPAVYKIDSAESYPASDNLSPQETTNQDTPDMGDDGAGLSCPGSSVVAENESERQWWGEG